jgi:UDP-N-acetylmuramate dehydrogenase
VIDRLRAGVPLAPRTTLAIGGPARFLLEATAEAEVAWAVEHAGREGLPLLVLGGGSNVLVADRGFDGLVLDIRLRGIEQSASHDHVEVTAAAGEEWDDFVAQMVACDLAGLECLSGIPGRVGATPIQNVGAYGQEVAETIVQVQVYDRAERKVVRLDRAACHFRYRNSRFKLLEPGRHVVLSVTFALRRGGAPALRYPELGDAVASRGSSRPGLREVRDAVLALRRAKSMVVDPGDPESTSVGSFFLNPIVPRAEADAATERARALGVLGPSEAPPRFEGGDGKVKLPAAWLIERAGFRKGEELGRAGISRNHALALVNRGGASAAEILALADRVRLGVARVFGIELVMEPVLVGF